MGIHGNAIPGEKRRDLWVSGKRFGWSQRRDEGLEESWLPDIS